MKIVVAIDSFKGCLTSAEANRAAATGIRDVLPDAEVVEVPVSDGGEGFVDAFHAASGGDIRVVTVCDPLMRPVAARYLLRGTTAVIEVAQACGLALLSREERNPMVTTSYGVGQLVADAVRAGARHIIVGLGGSATSDAGTGMLRALVDAFSRNGRWDGVRALEDVQFTIATDVRNPLCGPNGAAHVFAPQKGATSDMVGLLDERARTFAEVSARHFGYDCSGMEGAGAAGGLGYAFMQYMDSRSRHHHPPESYLSATEGEKTDVACMPGIKLLLESIHFDEVVKDADLIFTGEGAADRQTLMGKLPLGILQQAGRQADNGTSLPEKEKKYVPVCLIAGRVDDREELLRAGFFSVDCINQDEDGTSPAGLTLEEAMRKDVARQNIARTVGRVVKSLAHLSTSCPIY